jgi:hypothetical protein
VPDLATYEELKQVANELIFEAGRTVSFIQLDSTPDDTATPWENSTPRTGQTSVSLKGVFVEPESSIQLGESYVSKDLVKRSTKILIVEPGDNDLSTFDEINDGGVKWKIEGVEILKPGTVTIVGFVGVSR